MAKRKRSQPEAPISRRLAKVRRALIRELNLRGAPSTLQCAHAARAAALTVLAEQLRERKLEGDTRVSDVDLCRLDNSARRALKDLRELACEPEPFRPALPSISALMGGAHG